MNLRGNLVCVGLTDTGKVREHNEDTIASDDDLGLGRTGRRHGWLQRRRSRERHRRQDNCQSRPRRSSNARTSTVADPASGLTRPSHHPARRHSSRQQDHLPDRAHPGRMRGHGHDGRSSSVLRQPRLDRTRRRLAAVSQSRACQLSQVTWITRCCRSWWIGASTPPRRRSERPTRTM